MTGWTRLLGRAADPARLTLLLGGARSGKSRFGEELVLEAARGSGAIYIATAEALDDEMRQRIAMHAARRGSAWRTIEAPRELASVLGACGAQPVLVDCLTLWLSNLMLADQDVDGNIEALLAVIGMRTSPTVLISNEVGSGIVPETALGRCFRDEQGRLNQRIAAAADCVALMVAGLPLRLKPQG